MLNFINKNKYKIFMVVFLFVLLLTLSGCRTNSEVWYTKAYLNGWEGYKAEWSFQKFKNGEYIECDKFVDIDELTLFDFEGE